MTIAIATTSHSLRLAIRVLKSSTVSPGLARAKETAMADSQKLEVGVAEVGWASGIHGLSDIGETEKAVGPGRRLASSIDSDRMVLAQEITVEIPPDPISVSLSIVAVAIAATSLIVTYRQGREIRNIETREHEWQATDRKSAQIEVVPMAESVPTNTARGHSSRSWIRLRNRGRATANEITWEIDNPRVLLESVTHLDQLHPGEQFDLGTAPSIADKPVAQFTVRWVDENGPNESTRLVNL